MAEVDTSIYHNIQQPDPLGVAQKALDFSQGVTNNKLLQMQLAGRRQLGFAVQQATDPQTGQVDTARLSKILMQPENYAAAAEGAKFGLDVQSGQLTNTRSGMDIAQSGWNNLGTAWGARLSQSSGDVNPDDLRKDAVQLVAEGRMTPDQFLRIQGLIPTDPKAAREFAAGGFLQALGPTAIATPEPAPPGPGGAPRQQTAGQFVTQSMGGGAPPAAPGANPLPAPGAPLPSPGVVTGMGPGASAAVQAEGQASGAGSVQLHALASEVPTRKANLDNMLADAAEFTAGPASEELKQTIAGINELFGTKFDVDRVAAQDRFDKLANQIAQQQASAIGATDQQLATAMGANPNSRMSNLGIEGTVALLKGNEDAIAIKNEKWQDALEEGKAAPDEFYKWSAKFNRNYDPRVFQSVYLDQTAKQKMIATLSKTERAEFARKFNFAVQNGWIPDPRRQ